MIVTFVWIVIVVILAALALWVVQQVSADPQINKVARIAITIIAVLVIVGLVAGMFGVDVGLPVATVPR